MPRCTPTSRYRRPLQPIASEYTRSDSSVSFDYGLNGPIRRGFPERLKFNKRTAEVVVTPYPPTFACSRFQGDEMRDCKGGGTPKDNQLVREYRAIAFSTCGFSVNAANYRTRTWISSCPTVRGGHPRSCTRPTVSQPTPTALSAHIGSLGDPI